MDAAYSLAHHIADLVSLIDQLGLQGFAVVGQDWGGPQGTGAALARIERLSALTLMNTWLFTDYKGRFHTGARPWTTWHAPIIGPYIMKRLKILSTGGPSRTSKRGMSALEARAYHHVYDERESETVTLTWPRSIPLEEGDRGWADMAWIQAQLPKLADVPIQLLWAPEDQVFPIEYALRLKDLLPHAEDIKTFANAAHFLQDDRGPELAAEIVGFLDRTVGPRL
jgi:pimeloyl-ACP methyl ester carboxylesterase